MAGHASDICFTGAAMLPGFLGYADQPELAMLALIALLLGGAVCAIADPAAPHRAWSARTKSTTTRP